MEIPHMSTMNYMADNADHTVCSLDGKSDFHGMGIMAAVTPGFKAVHHIPRQKVEQEAIRKAANIKFQHYDDVKFAAKSLKFLKYSSVKSPNLNIPKYFGNPPCYLRILNHHGPV
jgi:hypothetical protein